MTLFTALWPPREATDHLAASVDRLRSTQQREVTEAAAGLDGFRFVPPERWHVTLCFHGADADQRRLSARLDRRIPRLSGNPAPRLRLRGTGMFRGVLWIGVEPCRDGDAEALRALVRAAGADPDDFRGHVTVARWGRGTPRKSALRALFEGYEGPWWSAAEVALVRSEQEAGARVYRTVHRASLLPGQHGGQPPP